MSIITKIFGDPNLKIIKSLQPIVDQINALEAKYEAMSVEELQGITAKLRAELGIIPITNYQLQAASEKNKDEKSKLELQEKLNALLPEAFAAVREAARRTVGQRHYDVQMVGGIILHRGQIAEMKTGEGKTLVATLPLYLNALTGQSVQLITVNDYLSKVGAGLTARIYEALGMTTGVIIHESALKYDPEYINEAETEEKLKHFKRVPRQDAYRCDVVYGTNNEFGFDYLKDNMVSSLDQMVQRGFYYTIVDEIDSILIDEARTPLIISAPAEESTDKYYKFSELVKQLIENEDYNVDEKMKAATLSEAGITKMEKWLGVENIYTIGGIREVHHIEQALKAHALFLNERDYIVKDGEVVIVDEFTGRLMHGRRYSEGLHQAIEAKESVKIQRESQTLATVTFQNYFRLYEKLAGMTGTAATEAEEFHKIYNLEVVSIPANKPNVRIDQNDLIYKTEMGKFAAVTQAVKELHKKGQPVLVGTISIAKNELLANFMEREGLRPQVLNAKNHDKEARFIADAGKLGTITIATNMAGRGVDIMLGGVAPEKDSPEYAEWQESSRKVKELGGLHVIGTERHESRRIDNQLRGRAGRQGDPGSSQFFVSMDDDLMRIFGGDRMKSIMTSLKLPEDMPIENKLISRSIESAQKKVEGNNFDIRKHLVDYDDVINKHREAIYRKRLEILTLSEINKLSESSTEVEGEKKTLSDIILTMVENEIEQVVAFHAAADEIKDWNVAEIYQTMTTIFPIGERLKDDLQKKFLEGDHKFDRAKARTEIIEHLYGMAKNVYDELQMRLKDLGVDWSDIEKSILIRAIDMMWIEHLEAVASVRQGIGLRGYGQRDPLIEYKKEAFGLYNQLNNLIDKEVVYSIYKIGMMHGGQAQEIKAPSLLEQAKQFSAPEKTMSDNSASFAEYKKDDSAGHRETVDLIHEKVKDEDGNKVGRNDLCPCGSGKKYKKCCGK